MNYDTFKVTIADYIATVSFNRPEKANSLNYKAWQEMQQIFEHLSKDAAVRVIILTGEGKHWCAGIDLELLMNPELTGIGDECAARQREKTREFIYFLQNSITSIERCKKPVLAAIHKGCIGGGVDIATACDIRYCTEDAYFTVKEVDMGLVADIGTLQRLPKIINQGIAYEMAYTGRNVGGKEAAEIGLVTRTYTDQATMLKEVHAIATQIAAKSPLVIRGTKEIVQYTRDHSVSESLHFMATYNAAFLMSNDLMEAFSATMQKRPPVFKGD